MTHTKKIEYLDYLLDKARLMHLTEQAGACIQLREKARHLRGGVRADRIIATLIVKECAPRSYSAEFEKETYLHI